MIPKGGEAILSLLYRRGVSRNMAKIPNLQYIPPNRQPKAKPVTPESLQQEITRLRKENQELRTKIDAMVLGSRGGKTRAAALTPERRSEIASQAAKARWKPNLF